MMLSITTVNCHRHTEASSSTVCTSSDISGPVFYSNSDNCLWLLSHQTTKMYAWSTFHFTLWSLKTLSETLKIWNMSELSLSQASSSTGVQCNIDWLIDCVVTLITASSSSFRLTCPVYAYNIQGGPTNWTIFRYLSLLYIMTQKGVLYLE